MTPWSGSVGFGSRQVPKNNPKPAAAQGRALATGPGGGSHPQPCPMGSAHSPGPPRNTPGQPQRATAALQATSDSPTPQRGKSLSPESCRGAAPPCGQSEPWGPCPSQRLEAGATPPLPAFQPPRRSPGAGNPVRTTTSPPSQPGGPTSPSRPLPAPSCTQRSHTGSGRACPGRPRIGGTRLGGELLPAALPSGWPRHPAPPAPVTLTPCSSFFLARPA